MMTGAVRRRCAILVMTIPTLFAATAQSSFRGSVTDEHDRPLEAATVKLLSRNAGHMIAYTLTDANGTFVLSTKQPADSLQISVSMLGYATGTRAAQPGTAIRFRLTQQPFALKEVEIRPGRVWGNQDTISYDVAQFIAHGDESVKDVIRKLPGITVDERGKISYLGKDISRFYVEGMDLVGGQYNRITDNLRAQSVETVRILENHQPVRALQKKILSEDIALDLKLKPEFRDRWMLTLTGGAGLDPPIWEASAHALQLSRRSQSVYSYKGNNAGRDASDEQMVFFANIPENITQTHIGTFLAQPSFAAPLKEERMLFNRINTMSANRLYKSGENTQVRINASGTHDIRQQERGSETHYYHSGDTVRIAEQSHTRRSAGEAELSVNIENNTAEQYITNRFEAAGIRERSVANYTGNNPTVQKLETTDASLANDFKTIRSGDKHTVQFRSTAQYNHRPSMLIFDATNESLRLRALALDNSVSYIRKTGSITHQYTAGIAAHINNIRSGTATFASPAWQWNTPKWRAALSVPLAYTAFPKAGWSRLAASPSLSMRYKLNYAWQFAVSGRYAETYGDVATFYAEPYRIDYRTMMHGNGIMPVNQQQTYSARMEYTRVIREFFAALSLVHVRTRADRITEQRFDNGVMTIVAHAMPNHATAWHASSALSKGLYDAGMKLSLNSRIGVSRGEQLSRGVRMPFRSVYMQYEPVISWTPSRRTEISYIATLRYGSASIGRETRLPALWHAVHKLQFTADISAVAITGRIDYYRNDVDAHRSANAAFADLALRWKTGSWQFTASASNLFDKQSYNYTEYTDVQSYTSWIRIRGRELIVSARYKF